MCLNKKKTLLCFETAQEDDGDADTLPTVSVPLCDQPEMQSPDKEEALSPHLCTKHCMGHPIQNRLQETFLGMSLIP